MTKRNFIKLSLITATSIFTPKILTAKNKSEDTTLILLELNGGNDSLNTFVPYSNKLYYHYRPDISISKENLHIINNDFGLNKNLTNIYNLYKQNNVAIINGLGYENPNLSHFRSIEIVETASKSNEFLNKGWIANELEKYSLNDTRPANALVIGRRKKGDLFSNDLNILQIQNINKFIKKSNKIKPEFNTSNSNNNLNYFFKQQKSIQKANVTLSKYAKNIITDVEFQNTNISNNFKEAFKIIKSKINIPVIKISQTGYDTHANQIPRQTILLKELDDAIGSFTSALKQNDLFDNVLIVSYSEFGRRVRQNASLGTDHGTASTQFVIGSKVKGGIYGEFPSLSHLYKKNLVYTTEYTSLYNTIITKWFNNPNNKYKNESLLKCL